MLKQKIGLRPIVQLRKNDIKLWAAKTQIYKTTTGDHTMFNPCEKKDPFEFEEISFESKDHKKNAPDDFEEVKIDEPEKQKRCVVL